MIQRAKFGSYLARTMWEEQVGWVAAEDVAQDLISYIRPKASKNAFFPNMDQVAKRRYNRIFLFSPVHCPFCTLPTDAATFKKLRGLFR